jgi:hypothetical protein
MAQKTFFFNFRMNNLLTFQYAVPNGCFSEKVWSAKIVNVSYILRRNKMCTSALPQIRPWPVPSTFFTVHYFLIILLFEDMWYELLKVLQNQHPLQELYHLGYNAVSWRFARSCLLLLHGWRISQAACLLPASCWFLWCSYFRSLRWRRHVPPKRRLIINELRSIISHKI